MSPHTSPSPGASAPSSDSKVTGLEFMLRDLMISSTFTTPPPPSSGPTDMNSIESPASHGTDDSLSNTDTENSSGASSDCEDDEERDWTFEVTPEITRRLSIVPSPEMTRRFSIVPGSTPPPLSLSQCMEGKDENAISEKEEEEEAEKITLPTLPNELKLEIFSHLDPIDATCLGLTSRHTYLVYRAIHGTSLRLKTRRAGPNNLEYAFTKLEDNMCRHCGKGRCELWMHVREFMEHGERGKEREYCGMKGSFGARGKEGTECWRGKPSKPRRCGKHPERTTTVRVEDGSENLERIVSEARKNVGV